MKKKLFKTTQSYKFKEHEIAAEYKRQINETFEIELGNKNEKGLEYLWTIFKHMILKLLDGQEKSKYR